MEFTRSREYLGYGKRREQVIRSCNTLCGAVMGVVVFWFCFGVTVWNEGVAIGAESKIADGVEATILRPCDSFNRSFDDRLVFISCPISNPPEFAYAPLGVKAFGLWFRGQVSQFQWQQNTVVTQIRDPTTGVFTSLTTYSYAKTWLGTRVSSDRFDRVNQQYPDFCSSGCINPALTWPTDSAAIFKSKQLAQTVFAGDYPLSLEIVESLQTSKIVDVEEAGGFKDEMTWRETGTGALPKTLTQSNTFVSGNMFYTTNQPGSPRVGDLKAYFEVGATSTVSILGKQTREGFEQYIDPKDFTTVFKVMEGEWGVEDIYTILYGTSQSLHWLYRILVVLGTWFSLQLILGPFILMPSLYKPLRGWFSTLHPNKAAILFSPLALAWCLLIHSLMWLGWQPLIGAFLLVGSAIALALFIHFLNKHNKKMKADAIEKEELEGIWMDTRPKFAAANVEPALTGTRTVTITAGATRAYPGRLDYGAAT